MGRTVCGTTVCWLVLTGAGLAVVSAADGPPTTDDPQAQATELNNLGVSECQAGRFETGVGYLRQAIGLNPADPQIRANLSNILTDWASQLSGGGQMLQAEPLLAEAIRYEPDNGRALVALGDLAYFTRSEFEQAIGYWTRANGKVPREVWHTVADRITQAQRDQLVERSFNSVKTAHFDIRVQSPSHPAVAALQQTLEAQYARLAQQLDPAPTPITVIVYTERDLHRLYNQRDWALGFYDGRLRLRWNEIESGQGVIFIAHELAHAFLHQLYGTRLPIWVHEGFAQYQEGDRWRSPEEERLEQAVVSGTGWIPLAWLDRRFRQPSGGEDTPRAYAESRWVVSELVRRYGMERLKQFMRQLAEGTEIEAAFDEAFAPERWFHVSQSGW